MGLWGDLFGLDQGDPLGLDHIGFGHNEVWSRVANEISADFTAASWFKKGRIDWVRDKCIILLDTYTVSSGESSVTYTRMRSPFLNKNNIRMNIYRKEIFSSIGKVFGMQDIEIGDKDFYDSFIVQGSPESIVIAFLNDDKIKRLIRAQSGISYKIKKSNGWFFKQYPDGVDELYFDCRGIVRDEQRLKLLFELFVVSIDKIMEIDHDCVFGLGILPK